MLVVIFRIIKNILFNVRKKRVEYFFLWFFVLRWERFIGIGFISIGFVCVIEFVYIRYSGSVGYV